jgi:hypothetical protein
MEEHRDEVSLIVAGYPTRWNASSAPGLASRLPAHSPSRTHAVGGWSTSLSTSHRAPIQLPEHTRAALNFIAGADRGQGFGNGRFARKVFQEMTERHARRIADSLGSTTDTISAEQLTMLTEEDLPELHATR